MSDVGVIGADGATTGMQVAYNKVFATLASAISIGTLTEDQSSLGVMSALSEQTPNNYYSFNFTSGSAMKLDFNNLTGTIGLRVQLIDVAGNVVADSGGTETQQANFNSLASSDGYAAANGTYYIKVTYASTKAPQDYAFRLYSGTTYTSSFLTTALIQPYDPNLFVGSATTMFAASSVNLYERTTTLALSTEAKPSTATDIGHLIANQTELSVSSVLIAANPDEYYHFNNDQNRPIKLSFSNATNTTSLRVQLLDKTGTKILADNAGTEEQKNNYIRLTSGAGLQADKGEYIAHVSYAPGAVKVEQNYSLQLYSGNRYVDIYSTTARASTSTTSKYQVGQNLNVFADSAAKLFTNNAYNTIDATIDSAINIGWIKQDSSALEVFSRLTGVNGFAFFRFTFQDGDNLRLGLKNLSSDDKLRVQVFDSTGLNTIADNEGTDKQKEAFEKLTSEKGIKAQSHGDYVIKVSYGKGADKSKNLDYDLELFSGGLYKSKYTTTISAQTYQNFLLSGGVPSGYSSTGAIASQLASTFSSFL